MKLRKTDTLFSRYIRQRDEFTCQRCGKVHLNGGRGLHTSHFWGRGRENTRLDGENCIALCFGCHQMWGHGDGRGEYMSYMRKRLGYTRYQLLELRAHTYKKRDDKLDEIVIRELIKELSMSMK